jgi:hypothetical protein
MNTSKIWITVLAGWLLLSGIEANALLLEFRPSNQSVISGGTLTADLWIRGSDPKSGVGAYDVTVNFDPVFLAFDSVSQGTHLGDTVGPFITSMPDSISIADISLETPADLLRLQQVSDFLLGSLHFNTLTAGLSRLDISHAVLGDVNGDRIMVDSLGSANIEVLPNAIPEPGTLLLLAIGLGILAIKNRKSSALAPNF